MNVDRRGDRQAGKHVEAASQNEPNFNYFISLDHALGASVQIRDTLPHISSLSAAGTEFDSDKWHFSFRGQHNTEAIDNCRLINTNYTGDKTFCRI